jgi:S-adenosylmethionine:tRNA ribosyltransferase-isomerase
MKLLVSDFDFELPEELIAQEPPRERGGARMLAVDRASGTWQDCLFQQLPEFLRAGDLLVLNNSRVIPARLFALRKGISAHQEPTGRIEVLLTQQTGEWEWHALVRPAKKVEVGEQLFFDETLGAEVVARGEFGERVLRFHPVPDFFAAIENLGHIPLPPYIHREDTSADRERYQTIYARERGSVAAPTAGLHFTPEILNQLQARGVRIAYVTLHVGLGTFAPLRVERLEEIRLHTERYSLPGETALEINAAVSEGRRILAAGTTTVRTLEHCAALANGAELEPHSGATNIFISPGHKFRLVQGLLTNFHLPKSSLLMLVSAFAGRENLLEAYRHAVTNRYRFFSYGDCMFLS